MAPFCSGKASSSTAFRHTKTNRGGALIATKFGPKYLTVLVANQYIIILMFIPLQLSRISGLLLHFCDPITAKSIAYPSLPIRPTFDAFFAHYFAVLSRCLPNHPHKSQVAQSSLQALLLH